MLYNILPPAIFIVSFGGIMVIVSRAVMRMRKEAFVADVKSYAQPEEEAFSIKPGRGISEAMEMLKPNQNSVQAIKSRLGLLKMSVSRAKESVRNGLQKARSFRPSLPKRKKEMAAETVSKPSDKELKLNMIDRMRGLSTHVTVSANQRINAWREKASTRMVAKPEDGKKTGDKLAKWWQQIADKSKEIDLFKKGEAQVDQQEAKPALETPAKQEAKISSLPKITVVTKTVENVKPVEPEVKTSRSVTTARLLLNKVRRQPATGVLEAAQEALQKSEYQKAEDLLVEHIFKHPKDIHAYLMLGRAAVARENWAEAIEIFDQVLVWDNNQAEAYASLGFAAYKSGKLTRALQSLQRAHTFDPDNEQVLLYLLDIARKMDSRALLHSLSEEYVQLQARQRENTTIVAS